MKKVSIFLFTMLGIPIVQADNKPLQPDLNQLDAQQQQRQNAHISQQSEQLQPQPDIRSQSESSTLTLPPNESPCYPIQSVTLTDYAKTQADTQFKWALDKAVSQLNLTLPRCLGGEGVGVLMKQIQNNIIEKGFVTTRIVAGEQDLSDGKLVLTVIPGKIRRTIVADSSPVLRFTRLHSLTGLTFSQGDLLNIRDIEQSLENLKRPPTVEANIEILPAEGEQAEAGESDVKISYAQALPFRLNFSLDDSGSKSTGKWQGSGTFSFDNMFSANDLFYSTFTHSIKRHSDDKGRRASKSFVLYYSVPFGYWLLSATHTDNRYHQEVFGAFDNTYIYSGESENDKLTLAYLLYRDNVRKTTVSSSFWSRQSQNYVDKQEVEVQKRRMAGWEAGLSHKEYIGNASLTLSANFKRGTGVRGALQAPEELWNEGTSRPKIITAAVSFSQPFSVGEQPLQFKSEWNAQWNKTRLIAQDRFSIGGRHTVRGFDGEWTLSGDRGWLWRNELAWNINRNPHQLYLGWDIGRTTGAVHHSMGHTLTGSAIGLRGEWRGFYYEYFIGAPINKPQGFKTSRVVTGFSLGYAF